MLIGLFLVCLEEPKLLTQMHNVGRLHYAVQKLNEDGLDYAIYGKLQSLDDLICDGSHELPFFYFCA